MKGFHNYVWSIYLILSGILFIVKHRYNLKISMPKAMVGLFFIFFGLYILSGGGWTGLKSENSIIFGNGVIKSIGDDGECNVIFSNGVIDLSQVMASEEREEIEVNVVFSNATLILSPDKPIVVEISTAFGATETPDGASTAFGEHVYRASGSRQEGEDHITIKANNVFGKLTIEMQQ
ncbi:MAG: cell wall-active antibiotics response protein [Clostridiales bacterium]|jgi:hypothetical protein|nr:cell wall-active antibiotics response protein [Clostridiales bacterium]